MGDHDGWYKRLFAHRNTVRDLVRAFVREPWVEELDFNTLKPVSPSLVGDKLERREADAVWEVTFRGQPLYVCLLVEFQSTVDRTMALRVAAYVLLLYQALDRHKKHVAGSLPPVLPVVFYNGEAPWTAARQVSELIAPGPRELAEWRPRLSYLLIDAHRRAAEPLPPDNLAAAICRLEACRSTEEMDRVLADVAPALAREQSVQRTVLDWLVRELVPHRLPGETLEKPATVKELRKMLQTRRTWAEMAKDDGLREGLEKGRKEGRREGEAKLLERQLELRFGPLPKTARRRLAQAGPRTLLRWGERLLTADSLDGVFGD